MDEVTVILKTFLSGILLSSHGSARRGNGSCHGFFCFVNAQVAAFGYLLSCVDYCGNVRGRAAMGAVVWIVVIGLR